MATSAPVSDIAVANCQRTAVTPPSPLPAARNGGCPSFLVLRPLLKSLWLEVDVLCLVLVYVLVSSNLSNQAS